jgi:hypothetical protein
LNALLRRPFFFEPFPRQYPQIVTLFRADDDEVAATFRGRREHPPPLQGLPKTTSAWL